MSTVLETLFADALFRFSNLSWLQVVDLVLVTLVFFFLLDLVRRSQAAFLLRGAAVVVLVLFVFTVFLPLPTFDWLVRGALLAILVATPVIFQPELRRLLERLGRSMRITSFQKQLRESNLLPIVRAVESMAHDRVGALIVLEGNEELARIVESGVPVRGKVTSELLHTIFFDGTPLHDGAALIRQDEVVAAGCVLPLSNRQLYGGDRRLGMRHRAALGVSEASDALAVIVSEETGQISVARNNQLDIDLDSTTLRERIVDFYQPVEPVTTMPSFLEILRQIKDRLSKIIVPTFSREGLSNIGLWLVAALLALTTWAFVIQETNPARQTLVDNIPLVIQDVPDNGTVLTDAPETVSAIIKTTDALLPSLSASAFQATISLSGKEPGLHRLIISVSSGISPVQIVSIEPDIIDVELARIISQTMDVSVQLSGEESLSPAFEVQETPTVTPTTVTVVGAEPAVKRIQTLSVQIMISDEESPAQRNVPVVALDADGQEVKGVTIEPAEVQINVPIVRRSNARIVGIQVVTQGELPDGYRISQIRTLPSEIIVLGSEEQLANLTNAVSTTPIDVSQIVGDLSTEVPLDIPSGMEVMNKQGETLVAVRVELVVVPREGTLTLIRPIEILNQSDSRLVIDPPNVELLLSGPLPILDMIAENPDLLRLFIDASDLQDLSPGQTLILKPRIVKPVDVSVQLIPVTVKVSITQ
jgi:diadenylate cyclase